VKCPGKQVSDLNAKRFVDEPLAKLAEMNGFVARPIREFQFYAGPDPFAIWKD